MSRQITSTGTSKQNYAEALRKLIPAEILIFYFSLLTVVPETLAPAIVVAFLAVLMTPFYLWFTGGVRKVSQIITSTLSMVIYTMVFGSLADFMPEDLFWLPAVLTITWTFAMPMFFMGTTTEEAA